MALPRVKQSCIPCRQRKSRCNAETPCSSCVLRGTERDCALPSGSNPAPPRRKATVQSTPRKHPVSTPYTIPTAQHHIQHYQTPEPSSDTWPTTTPTKEDQHLWVTMLDTLPPRAVCEVLLEYLYNECDWLVQFGDVIGLWTHTIRREAVDRSTAGYLYATLAMPALLLGDHGSPLYRLPTARDDHPRLLTLAQACVPKAPQTLMDLDLVMALMFYDIYSGTLSTMAKYFDITMQIAIEQGLFDESAPQWGDITNEERNTRRRLGWGFFSVYRWSRLYENEKNPLSEIRFNLCRPAMTVTQLEHAVSLPLPPRSHVPGDLSEQRFRVLRVRSQVELNRVAQYRHISSDITDLIPRAHAFVSKIGKVGTEALLGECELLYRDLYHWWTSGLPSAGFALDPLEDIDPTDIVSCRYACQSLILRLALCHIGANFLRYWLEIGDIDASSPSPQKRMYQACLDNAKRSMDCLPAVRLLVSSGNGPFIVPFMAANLFNAATSYAIPVLRAVRLWSTSDATKDIASLPAWPDGQDPRNKPPLPPQNALGRLPKGIYTDSMVKECATYILVILDALTAFNANPLGQTAARKLNGLITQYGLRDVTTVPNIAPFDPAVDRYNRPAPQLQYGVEHTAGPANDKQTAPAALQGQALGPSTMDADQNATFSEDMAFINGLLQLDASVWEGLLDAGAFMARNEQALS